MSHRESFRTPGKLLALFLIVVGVPFAALALLGWYVIKQDSALEERRIHEHLDGAAGLICGELDRKVSRWAEVLRGFAEGTPTNLSSDVACVVFDATRAVRHQSSRLVFLPFLPSQDEPFAWLLAAAEAREYREEDYARAGAS